jgi:signal transduction histidine kinase
MEWKESLLISKKWILYIVSTIIIAGYLSDISGESSSLTNPLPNLIAIIVTISAIVALIGKVIKIQLASAVVIYTLVINIIISYFLNYKVIHFFEGDILRSALIFTLLITIAGFTNGKWHSLSIGCLCIIWLISVIIISKNQFLIENLFIIFIVILGYTFGLFFLFKLLEKNMLAKNRLIAQLEVKTNELEKSNQLLIYEKSVSETQKNELKALIESREKLFSIISHDIKNPLSAIMGFSELIGPKIESKDFVKVAEFNKIIFQSSSNLYRLLINLLDWTKMQSGKLKVTPEYIDLNTLINESLAISNTSLEQKQINLEIKSQEGSIFADKNMLTTIIRNLFSNALKYTLKGGRISIESKIENKWYFFSIADTGLGMESSVIDSILNDNAAFSTNGTDGETGTGFGLVLCKEFIKLHHGKLSITSEPGNGSEFLFNIPVEYGE